MKLLIDDNILLDVLMKRELFLTNSARIWRMCESGQTEGIVTTHSIANIMYVARRKWNPEERNVMLRKIRSIFSLEATKEIDLIHAASYRWNDFEDAVRSAVARRIGADYIITRVCSTIELPKKSVQNSPLSA